MTTDPDALRHLLATKRHQARREDHPDLPGLRMAAGLTPAPRTRAQPGLTQQDMDVLIGRELGTYTRLERGLRAEIHPDLLRRIAAVLHFDEREWGALWLALYGQQPSPSLALHPGDASAVPAIWRTVVDTSPLAAYLNDLAWDMIHFNAGAERMWGAGNVPGNTILWILGDRTARDRVMTDWAADWGRIGVAQLANALHAYPHHPRLLEIKHTVLRDNAVHRLWRERADPYLHPDGDRR